MPDLMDTTFNDPALQRELAQLTAALELLSPRPRLGSRFGFYGEESVPFHEAMQLMGRMQELEELEPDSLSPLEALQKLYELRAKLEQ